MGLSVFLVGIGAANANGAEMKISDTINNSISTLKMEIFKRIIKTPPENIIAVGYFMYRLLAVDY